MPSARFNRLQRIFDGACSLAGDERLRFLEEACGRDAELLCDVQDLLDRGRDVTIGIHAGLAHEASDALEATHPTPERIGPYEVLGILGRGGMGVVYRARRTNLERAVALKVLRPAFLSDLVGKRFELEKQILARLQHPGIAQIFEAGTADLGSGMQPWFAMELVTGERLSQWAAGRPMREKLELVIRVCDAVHHAHQKGVVHRDLKPDNILVTNDGRPKVLDFGVARVTDSDIQLTTIHTGTSSLIGTLPYMSPEQVVGPADKLDVRSDVYALGVLVHELLTGELPYDLTGKSVAEAVRVITDEDPTPPSSVDRIYRGDLDTIVARALEKEPDRRYGSAVELAADLQRFLDHKPILARPPSTVYQIEKFVRRHRGLVGGLTATLVVLVGAVIGLSISTVEARRAEADAGRRLATSNAVNEYMETILTSVDHTQFREVQGRDVKVVDVLDAASEEAAAAFAEQPVVEGAVRRMLGTSFMMLAELDKADRELTRAVSLLERHAPEDVETADALSKLSLLRQQQGDVKEAIELDRRVLDMRTRILGADHADTFAAVADLSTNLYYDGRFEEVSELLERNLAACEAALGREHHEYLSLLNNYSFVVGTFGRLRDMLPLMAELYEIRKRVLGPTNSWTLLSQANYAHELQTFGRLEEAEAHFREVYTARLEQFGERHEGTLVSKEDLFQVLGARGMTQEALVLAEEQQRTLVDFLGEEHRLYARSLDSLTEVYEHAERYDDAERVCGKAIESYLSYADESHPGLLAARWRLGRILLAQGDLAEARVVLDSAVSGMREHLPTGHHRLGSALESYGQCLSAASAFAEAEEALEECVPILTEHFGPDDVRVQGAKRAMAEARAGLGD